MQARGYENLEFGEKDVRKLKLVLEMHMQLINISFVCSPKTQTFSMSWMLDQTTG